MLFSWLSRLVIEFLQVLTAFSTSLNEGSSSKMGPVIVADPDNTTGIAGTVPGFPPPGPLVLTVLLFNGVVGFEDVCPGSFYLRRIPPGLWLVLLSAGSPP